MNKLKVICGTSGAVFEVEVPDGYALVVPSAPVPMPGQELTKAGDLVTWRGEIPVAAYIGVGVRSHPYHNALVFRKIPQTPYEKYLDARDNGKLVEVALEVLGTADPDKVFVMLTKESDVNTIRSSRGYKIRVDAAGPGPCMADGAVPFDYDRAVLLAGLRWKLWGSNEV